MLSDIKENRLTMNEKTKNLHRLKRDKLQNKWKL